MEFGLLVGVVYLACGMWGSPACMAFMAAGIEDYSGLRYLDGENDICLRGTCNDAVPAAFLSHCIGREYRRIDGKIDAPYETQSCR